MDSDSIIIQFVWFFLEDRGSGLVALLALFVSFWSLRAQRIHNVKSVTPALHFHVLSDNNTPYKWTLKNSGVGPAIIEDFTIVFGSQRLTFPSSEEVTKGIIELGIVSEAFAYHLLERGDFMSAGHSEIILEVSVREAVSNAKKLEQIQWCIVYSDIYGNRKTLSGRGLVGRAA